MTTAAPDPPVRSTDRLALRAAFSNIPSCIAAVCSLRGGEPVGMATSTLTVVSLEPPLVSVCIQTSSRTWTDLRRAPALGVSVLPASDVALCQQLAQRDGNRFAGVGWTASPENAVLIDGAALHLQTRLISELPAGDHVIALLAIHVISHTPDIEPAVFHRSTIRTLR